jgi:hypothetical protein
LTLERTMTKLRQKLRSIPHAIIAQADQCKSQNKNFLLDPHLSKMVTIIFFFLFA